MELMIRQERKRLGWSQEQVAKQIGVTLSTVQKIENGQRHPSFGVLVKLEDLFCMDYRVLFNLPQRELRENTKKPDGNQAE